MVSLFNSIAIIINFSVKQKIEEAKLFQFKRENENHNDMAIEKQIKWQIPNTLFKNEILPFLF